MRCLRLIDWFGFKIEGYLALNMVDGRGCFSFVLFFILSSPLLRYVL